LRGCFLAGAILSQLNSERQNRFGQPGCKSIFFCVREAD